MASVLRHPGALHALDAHAVARRLRGAVDLSLETMDDLDANDVVLQFVAVRRSGGAVPQVRIPDLSLLLIRSSFFKVGTPARAWGVA